MVLKESVIDNWASALTKIAIKENKVNLFIEQSNALVEVLKNKDDFFKILTFKTSHDEVKRINIIEETFAQFDIDEDILNSFKILVKLQAFSSVRQILKKLRNNLSSHNNIVFGVIWSTEKVIETQIKIIEEKVSKKLNKKVKLINKLDEKLIGGIQVIVHHKVFDGSVKGKLDEMKYKVLKNEMEVN
ncbi:F0F1 ATP synthase subunit delta [Mesoplasma corruscae]|uniref:ATP synthase subunit delta n=1 Tax=Mesoplasma corruscae TaxID=216874 RepID=A0A2S5RGZ2_9MOLU|nr:F0F1 ATP synthase subunit delta [Mesoplasma corruscae]PPE06573.1 F0F1 ATP synthase subunit delta [Mesoplasma corruscae]